MSPPASFGTYRVLHQIGSGVLGPVFRAYDSQQDRLVAIKTFTLDLVPEDAARLADQLRALTRTTVAHPAIVAGVEAGLSGATPFLALEYAGGESLDVVSRQSKAWTLARALPVLRGVAAAIDAAWAQGTGHGALHPRDVFVAAGASDLQITGFGIGQALEAIGARAPLRRPYSAPERVGAGSWDVRADVYSLGIIAHEMLSGHRPVGLDADVDASASELTPDERAIARRVLAMAMAESPADRYTSATEFVNALAAASHPPVAAPDPPTKAEGRLREPAPVPLAGEAREPAAPSLVLPRPRPRPSPIVETTRRIEDSPVLGQRHGGDEPPDPPFPWAATVAVLLAGLVLGGVIGYQIGWSRGHVTPAAPAPVVTSVLPSLPPAALTTEQTPPPIASPAVTSVAKSAATGRLVIQSVPSGALVTLDGQRAGETPLTLTVPLGHHDIQIARSGYVPAIEHVDVTARPRTMHVQLRRGVGRTSWSRAAPGESRLTRRGTQGPPPLMQVGILEIVR